jgi:hypothetical protein
MESMRLYQKSKNIHCKAQKRFTQRMQNFDRKESISLQFN